VFLSVGNSNDDLEGERRNRVYIILFDYKRNHN